MTIEELEVVISASIEPALKEIKKLVPQIKQQVEQATSIAQKSFNSMNMNGAKNSFEKAVNQVKSKLLGLTNKDTSVKIKVNKEEASKQITQLEKEIESLEKKIQARKFKINAIDAKMVPIEDQIVSEYAIAGTTLSDDFMNRHLSNNKEYSALSAEATKLDNEMVLYVSRLKEAKSELSQLQQQTNGTGTAQSKLGSIFSIFKSKIGQAVGSTKLLKGGFNSVSKVTAKITNHIKNIGTGMKSGLSKVLRYAGALFSLRTIYTTLSGAAQAWLSSQNAGAQQLSANIEYMKYAMGSAFAPVIEYVISLVYKLMKALQSVVYAFSGINIFAKATASSMKSTAGSASKASKSLSGVHGEINNVSENNGGGAGSGTVSPNIDLSSVDKIDGTFLEAIQNKDWSAVGAAIGQKINSVLSSINWDSIKEKAANLATNLTSGINSYLNTVDWYLVGDTIAQGINTAITFAFNFVTTMDWVAWGTSLAVSFGAMFNNIDWTMLAQTLSGALNGLLDTIIAFFININWLEIGMSIGEFLANIDWLGVLQRLFVIVCEAIMVVIMLVAGFVWEILASVGEFLYNGLIEPCIVIFTYLWDVVCEWFGKIKDTIVNIFTNIKNFVVNVWNRNSYSHFKCYKQNKNSHFKCARENKNNLDQYLEPV